MRFSSYWCTVVSVFKRRLRLELFFSRIWLCPLLRRLSLPFFVTAKRPEAPLWVFIFGIFSSAFRASTNQARGTGVAVSPHNRAQLYQRVTLAAGRALLPAAARLALRGRARGCVLVRDHAHNHVAPVKFRLALDAPELRKILGEPR